MNTEYTIDTHCGHCDKETEHIVSGYSHERDSSGELYTCKECGWWASGLDGGQKYHEPIS
jgi:hypothetical protein